MRSVSFLVEMQIQRVKHLLIQIFVAFPHINLLQNYRISGIRISELRRAGTTKANVDAGTRGRAPTAKGRTGEVNEVAPRVAPQNLE